MTAPFTFLALFGVAVVACLVALGLDRVPVAVACWVAAVVVFAASVAATVQAVGA